MKDEQPIHGIKAFTPIEHEASHRFKIGDNSGVHRYTITAAGHVIVGAGFEVVLVRPSTSIWSKVKRWLNEPAACMVSGLVLANSAINAGYAFGDDRVILGYCLVGLFVAALVVLIQIFRGKFK